MPELLHYYSLIVTAPYEIAIPQHLMILEEGFNVVTLSCSSIESFLKFLEEEGCTIIRCNQLDVSEPIPISLLGVGEEP